MARRMRADVGVARGPSAAPPQIQGQGDPNARIVFITGNAGTLANESGQLFDKMLEAIGLKREQVYIADVAPEDIQSRMTHLNPEMIVSLSGSRSPMQPLTLAHREIRLVTTWHPAHLLRDPGLKKETWADLQAVARELGLQIPKKETR